MGGTRSHSESEIDMIEPRPIIIPDIPRPLTLLSLPNKILSKILFHVMQVNDTNDEGERYSICGDEYEPMFGMLIEPIAFNGRLYRLALQAFLDANVFYLECGPEMHFCEDNSTRLKARLYHGDVYFTPHIKHLDLRLELAGIKDGFFGFDVEETKFCLAKIEKWARDLKQILRKVETLSLWLSCETAGSIYRHGYDSIDGLVALSNRHRVSERSASHSITAETLEPVQIVATVQLIQETMRAFCIAGFEIRSVSFDGWDTVKETMNLCDARSLQQIALTMTHERNEGKQFLVWVPANGVA